MHVCVLFLVTNSDVHVMKSISLGQNLVLFFRVPSQNVFVDPEHGNQPKVLGIYSTLKLTHLLVSNGLGMYLGKDTMKWAQRCNHCMGPSFLALKQYIVSKGFGVYSQVIGDLLKTFLSLHIEINEKIYMPRKC